MTSCSVPNCKAQPTRRVVIRSIFWLRYRIFLCAGHYSAHVDRTSRAIRFVKAIGTKPKEPSL